MKKAFTLFAALMMVFSMNAAIYLPGSWNGWNQTGDAFSGTPLTSKITLAANTEYKFKVKDGSSWYGNNGKITSDVTDWTFSTSEGDCILQSKLAGVYTFTWDATNHKLSVAYPTEEVVVEYTYTIVGSSAALFGNTWDPSCTANDMTKDGATYTLTKTNITLAVGDVLYKVVREHAWGTGEYPSGTNKSFSITEAGVYDVTFTYDGGSNLTATPTLKEAQKVIPTIAVKGSWDEWTLKNLVLANDELTATATINIATVGDYKFGVDVDGVFTANGATVSRESNVVAGLTGNTGDMTLKADVAGEYTFTWTFETNTLTVTYPELPTYTVTVTAENGTVEGDGEYKEGTEVTLTATPAEGYQFVNWTSGETVVSTENPYSFVVTADVALVANFKEAEPEYQVIEDEITNFVFDTEAWPMVCQGGPSAIYQIEVFLVLTEDADGTLSYEDCSVSIMGTDATFIEGTLSDIDVSAPSADAVLRVQWNEEFYELHLAMSAAAEPTEPTNVLVTNAVKSYDEGSGALKLTGLWEGAEVFVEIGGYEGKESIEYSTPQGVLFETPDVAAFGNEASIIVAGEDITVVCNGLKPMMGNDVYNVTITTLSEVSTALDNLNTTVAPVKAIVNGQLVITKDGVQYNAQGAILK